MAEPARDDIMAFFQAIAAGDTRGVARILRIAPQRATEPLTVGATRAAPAPYWIESITHYVYAGDTPLHVTAAAYARAVAQVLLAAGADARARNRRGAEPLHYAADGGPGLPTWNPPSQAAVIECLIGAGADPNATDKSGVAPLHRAIRARCTGAVRALLVAGADPTLKTASGTTPLRLAELTTGRGGAGSNEARREQKAILALLRRG